MPGPAERVIRAVRDVAAIAALALASVLMLMFIGAAHRIGDAVDQVNDPAPEPTVTGCPFGDLECGG